jgi:hypothetical protein
LKQPMPFSCTVGTTKESPVASFTPDNIVAQQQRKMKVWLNRWKHLVKQ